MTSRAARGRVDLATDLGGLRLASPILTAAGTSGHGAELGAYFDLARLGAVVVKSLAAEPWPGNPAPRVAPVAAGMLNSVGLQGPGVAAWLDDDLPGLIEAGATVVASIWGRTVADYGRAAALLAAAPACVVAIEVNISCPNLEDRRRMFAHSPDATAEVLAATASCGRPRFAKLSPNVADIVEIAGAALGVGAAGLVCTNTLLGMAIDLERRRPALGAGGGGLSGAALHPVAVRAVHECRSAFPDAAIVGVGGVATGRDAVEFLMAGADAVEVGTATFADPRAPARVLDELVDYCARHSIRRVGDLVGVGRAEATR